MQYVFPAIFTTEESGVSVTFPDLDGCITSGETLAEALYMAQDALSLMLMTMEDDGDPIPMATDIKTIACGDQELATLVRADTTEYRRQYGRQAIKKTLSIPAWLNTEAERKGINFSAVLQAALKQELHIAGR